MAGRSGTASVPTVIDKGLLKQMDADFHALLEHHPGDVGAAFQEACMANLGIALPDGDTRESESSFMFREVGSDLQATSKPSSLNQEVIRSHLAALKQFTEAELNAAYEDMEAEEQEGSVGSRSDDENMGEASASDDDDIPLARMATRA